MKTSNYYYPVLMLSLPLIAGVIFSSATGLFSPGFYDQETLNWQIQSKGQDIVDLFVVAPVLLLSAWMAFRKNKIALLIWAGTNLYLIYTFLIFCFGVHFNALFLVYCLNLGLSFYSLLYFAMRFHGDEFIPSIKNISLIKITSVYFIAIAFLFYGLWLSEIIPWINSDVAPETLKDIGLPTNPVHVIDLSMLLPAVFIIGTLLWEFKPAGFRLAPVFLVFFILMNFTIAVLNYMINLVIPSTGSLVTWIMSFLAFFSLVLLGGFLAGFRENNVIKYANQV